MIEGYLCFFYIFSIAYLSSTEQLGAKLRSPDHPIIHVGVDLDIY